MSDTTAAQSRMSKRDSSNLLLTLVVVALTGVITWGTPTLAAQDVPAWAQEVERSWWDAFNAGNARNITRLFTEDGVVLHPNQSVHGRELLRQFFTAVFRAARYDCEWTIDRVVVLDELAVISSSSQCTKAPLHGDTHSIPLDLLKAYERQGDGSWLIVRGIARPPLEQ